MAERSRYFPGNLVPIPSMAPPLESPARERFPGHVGGRENEIRDDTASGARAPRVGSVAWHGAGARGGSGDGSGLGLPVANCLTQVGRRNCSPPACVAVRCIRDGWSGPGAACGLDGAGSVWPPTFVL